jgi:hypothetical protein
MYRCICHNTISCSQHYTRRMNDNVIVVRIICLICWTASDVNALFTIVCISYKATENNMIMTTCMSFWEWFVLTTGEISKNIFIGSLNTWNHFYTICILLCNLSLPLYHLHSATGLETVITVRMERFSELSDYANVLNWEVIGLTENL